MWKTEYEKKQTQGNKMERNKKDSRGLKIVEGKMQMKQNIEAPPAVHPMAERSKIKKKK